MPRTPSPSPVVARLALLTLFPLLGPDNPARSAILPNEVGIVVSGRSTESQALGEHYASQRNIPRDNICVLDVPEGEVLAHDVWEKSVRPALRRWLNENKRSTQLRCLVTTWGIPLKIDHAATLDRPTRLRRTFLELERTQAARRIIAILNEIRQLGDQNAPDAAAEAAETNRAKSFEELAERDLQAAQQRVSAISEPQQRQLMTQKLEQLLAQTGGYAMYTNVLSQALNRTPADQQPGLRARLAQLHGTLSGLSTAKSSLEALPASLQREASILGVLNGVTGRLGQLAWLETQLDLITKNETGASFDSELSLILWPEHDSLRWQPNYLHYQFDASAIRSVLRTMMVARLDGPTIEIARGLVDKAKAAEADGVDGTVYLDARGLSTDSTATPPAGSFEEYDVALIRAEQSLAQQTQFPVQINRDAVLFQSGECPQALFYCGWYSLANYVDAFEWMPGAVGYHLASSEAATLHDPASNVWCKKMLEDGITATIGPVYEPYISAFPRPDEFFPLFLTGKYSLVECYYRTQPMNSWMMTLIGDPLYNPFANRPALEPQFVPANIVGSE